MPALTWRLFANPIFNSVSPLERNLSRLNPSEATFATLADGGYGTAELTFENVPLPLMEEALNEWRMKRVTATDSAGFVAYEGFVSEINVTTLHHDYTWSIDAFANRAMVRYHSAGADCTKGGTCYVVQQTEETAIDSGYTSQTDIGIKEYWDDLGEDYTTSTLATRKGKHILARVLKPVLAQVSLGTGSAPQHNAMILTLWGAWSTLTWRRSVRSANGSTEMKTHITNILGDGKTQYISSDTSHLDTIGQTFPYNQGQDWLTIQDWIAGVLDGGDSTGTRVFFQIWEDRVPWLFKRSTSPTYYTKANDGRIFNADRAPVPGYSVRAGGYLQVDSMAAGVDEAADVIARPRVSLIEETNYDAIKDTLTIPPPQDLLDTRRLHARNYKQQRTTRIKRN